MTHDLTDKGMARIWQEEYAARKLAGLAGSLSFGFALDQAVAAVSARIRDAAYENAAKVAQGEVYEGRYRTWPWWKPDQYGNRGNLDREDGLVTHCDEIASAIRSLSKPLEKENG